MANSYEHLLPPSWKSQVTAWLAEDTPSFDYGGYVVGEVEREAFLFGKGKIPAVLAGSPFFTEVFAQLGCQYVRCLIASSDVFYHSSRVEWHIKEGETFEPIKHVATVKGKARHLLLGERVALNMLARCSGIATQYASYSFLYECKPNSLPPPPRSKKIKDLARGYGYNGIIAGTRKTTPGTMFFFRVKYGSTHTL